MRVPSDNSFRVSSTWTSPVPPSRPFLIPLFAPRPGLLSCKFLQRDAGLYPRPRRGVCVCVGGGGGGGGDGGYS